MNRVRLLVRFLYFLLLIMGMATAGWSQSQRQDTLIMRVEVPFDFMAGGVQLDAGKYDVLHVNNPSLILIRGANLKVQALVPLVQVTQAKPGKASTKLVFNRYGDRYFLSQVWSGPDDEQVHHCFKCPAEKALEGQTPEVIKIPAQPEK